MTLAVAYPWPLSIWQTPEVYLTEQDAINAALEEASSLGYEGYLVSGFGFQIVDHDERTDTTTYKGYVTIIGRAPAGSTQVGSQAQEKKDSHMALAIGASVVGGLVVGGIVGYALR